MLKRFDDHDSGSVAPALPKALVHVSDEEPGFSRKRSGRGFSYRDTKGHLLRDKAALDRIRALVIPPAWSDVWIAPEAQGHIQVTGRDIKGRKQYRYHEQWTSSRDSVKFSSLADFAEILPKLRERIEADLRLRGLPFDRVVASIVWLLDNTMIRVGNSAYARDNKSFGLTTLRNRHVKIDGGKLRFAFKGKSGKEWNLQLVDRRISRIVRSIQELPGQHLFQFLDEEGRRRPMTSQDVNEYIKMASGSSFSSKYFRTWGGTIHAVAELAGLEVPDTKSAKARALNAAIDKVAARLGNTRAVCRKSYIHPAAIEQWSEGKLASELEASRKAGGNKIPGLDEEEEIVRRWLKRASKSCP